MIFNYLVTKAVHDHKFQLLNYAKSMKYKSNLARWLHKRISHKFVQASWNNTYQNKLSSKKLAQVFLGFSNKDITKAVNAGELMEVNTHAQEIQK